jgi:hypothetical protein
LLASVTTGGDPVDSEALTTGTAGTTAPSDGTATTGAADAEASTGTAGAVGADEAMPGAATGDFATPSSCWTTPFAINSVTTLRAGPVTIEAAIISRNTRVDTGRHLPRLS